MTMLLVLQTEQARNSTGALPTAKTMDELDRKLEFGRRYTVI